MSRGVHTGTPPELETNLNLRDSEITRVSVSRWLARSEDACRASGSGPHARAALTVLLSDLISSSEREGSRQALSPLQTRDGGSVWLTHMPGTPSASVAGPGQAMAPPALCNRGAPTLSRAAAQQAPLGKLLHVTNNHILKVTFYLKAASPHSQWHWVPRPGFPPSLLAGRPASSGCCQDFPFSSTSSPKFFHFGDVILRSRVHCFCFLPHPVAERPLGLCSLSLSHRGRPGAGDVAPARVGSAVAPVVSHPRAGAQTPLGAVLGPGSSMARTSYPTWAVFAISPSTCFWPGLCSSPATARHIRRTHFPRVLGEPSRFSAEGAQEFHTRQI